MKKSVTIKFLDIFGHFDVNETKWNKMKQNETEKTHQKHFIK